MEICKELKGSK